MYVLLGFQEVSNQPPGSEKIIENREVRFLRSFFQLYTSNFIVNMKELGIQLYNCNGKVRMPS